MKKVIALVATLIKKVAEKGAGVASMGLGYEPKMPHSLKK